jgi:hypothetical protein
MNHSFHTCSASRATSPLEWTLLHASEHPDIFAGQSARSLPSLLLCLLQTASIVSAYKRQVVWTSEGQLWGKESKG